MTSQTSNRSAEIDRRVAAVARGTLLCHPARVAKLTELLLTGHSWQQVKRTMNLSHEQFSELLNAAVYKANEESWRDPDVGPLGSTTYWPASDHYR
jgi:hypothetical protein